MSNGELVAIGRCAVCHKNGINTLRMWDGNGKVFWSSDEQYMEIAKSQKGPDALILADPCSHIPWVASCGCYSN